MKSLIISRGRALSPTPPKQTNRNHPMNAINAMAKIGKETGRDSVVEDVY